jgi:Asp-tRNA(Asn)/Glu-tRNA(Gln) amidotransferase B subunit
MTCLEDVVKVQIQANQKMIAHYGERRDKLVEWFTGRVMTETGGAFMMDDVRLAVHEYLEAPLLMKMKG